MSKWISATWIAAIVAGAGLVGNAIAQFAQMQVRLQTVVEMAERNTGLIGETATTTIFQTLPKPKYSKGNTSHCQGRTRIGRCQNTDRVDRGKREKS
jgi:hypothetical protein